MRQNYAASSKKILNQVKKLFQDSHSFLCQLMPDFAQKFRRNTNVLSNELLRDPLHDLGVFLQEFEVSDLGWRSKGMKKP